MLGYAGVLRIEGTRLPPGLWNSLMTSELQWYFLGDPCVYCGASSLCSTFYDERTAGEAALVRHKMVVCPLCGWWLKNERRIVEHEQPTLAAEYTYLSSLREFDCLDENAPLDLVRAYIAKRWDNIRDVHPRKVEQIAAAAFSDFFGCEVRLTAYSKDGGVDMYAVISNSPWAFQVKRTGQMAEGVEKVREFLGAMVENGIANGVFVTTARKFTKGARAVGISPHVIRQGVQLELVDGNSFAEIFDLHYFEQSPPWKDCWPGALGDVKASIEEARRWHR